MKPNHAAAAAMTVAALSVQPVMSQNVTLIEADGLRIHVLVSDPGIFRVASVVLEGEREVALVDAQFTASDADRVTELIRQIGKPLKTIFISYSDPDYYFGLARLAAAFPGAKIVATPQTVWLIDATRDDKKAVWAPRMGSEAPQKFVLPKSLTSDHFMLENRRIEIHSAAGDEQHSFLWIPSARVILGGVYLTMGQHLWVADSPLVEDRTRWLAGLDAMASLRPAYTIPAHFDAAAVDFRDTRAIEFTRRYLLALEAALSNSETSADVISKMNELYADLADDGSLEMTAKVLKGEMPWQTVRAFPAIGRRVEVDFGGEYDFELNFRDETTMSFRGLKQREGGRPMTDTVHYTAVEIAPGVYMVYWTESNGTHVIHVEDYGQGVAYTNIAAPDGSFTNLKGTLRLIPLR